MIVTRLVGGLGNQLFQYAAGRRLAHRLGEPLYLDLEYYKKNQLRTYSLDAFNIDERIADQEKLAKILGPSGKGLKRIVFRIRQLLKIGYDWNVIREGYVSPLNHTVLHASGNVYLSGYWQSEKYFLDVQDIIRSEIGFRHALNRNCLKIAEMITNTQSVSVHIRRGDYVSDPLTRRVHDVCDSNYYQECVRRINEQIREPFFFIFTNDAKWATDNLEFKHASKLISSAEAVHDYDDLRLMSMCKHHIIANSSFSWWGAWLDPNPAKIVLAPDKWFNDPRYDTSDVIPDTWIKVKVEG